MKHINRCLLLLDLGKVGTLIFHVFLTHANLPHLQGRLAHVQKLRRKPLPPIPYEQSEMCVGQIVAQECY
jgi:hypothetical protein